ncbi:MAG: hypothetical protein IKX68_08160 [Clostridiales bacterium]|nr:hypothetical protein [Clostridiales bacterium]
MLYGIVIVLLFIRVRPYMMQKRFLSEKEYKNIIAYSNEEDISDSFYKVGTLLMPSEKTIKADVLMEKNVEYSAASPAFSLDMNHLSSSQVIVSKNLASKCNSDVGEVLKLHSALTDQDKEYEVVGLLPVVYGILSEDFDTRYGIVIVGYDRDLIINNSVSSVVFGDDDFSASENHLEIKDLVRRDDQIAYCDGEIIGAVIKLCMATVVISIFSFALCFIFGSSRLQSRVVFGSNLQQQYGYVLQNYTLMAIVPGMLATVGYASYAALMNCFGLLCALPLLCCIASTGVLSLTYLGLVRRKRR